MPQALVTNIQIDEIPVIRSLCKASFFDFVREFWSTIIHEEPIWNFHIEVICDTMQEAAERVFANEPCAWDLLVNVPPGTTKSSVCSIFFAPWTWTRMATARHILACHSDNLVTDHSRKARLVVQSDKYRACFPEISISEDQNSKSYFVLDSGGFRLSCTVGGKSPIGFHAHFLGVDDPIEPERAKSISAIDIKKANDFVTEYLPSRKVDKAVAFQYLVMQRLAQNDPAGHLLKKHSSTLKHICLPATRSPDVKPGKLRKYYTDGLLDPVRLNRTVLAKERAKLGEFGYACQYKQRPIPIGGGMFKPHRLNHGTPPSIHDPTQWKYLWRYWDKAGTHAGGTFTVGALMGMTKGTYKQKPEAEYQWLYRKGESTDPIVIDAPRIWILHIVREQLAADKREELIRKIAKQDGYHVRIAMEQEPGSSGKDSVDASIRGLSGYRVKADKPTGEKAVRCEPLADQMNQGLLWIAYGEWNQDLIDELKYYPFSTFKDQGDALGGAYKMISNPPPVVGAL